MLKKRMLALLLSLTMLLTFMPAMIFAEDAIEESVDQPEAAAEAVESTEDVAGENSDNSEEPVGAEVLAEETNPAVAEELPEDNAVHSDNENLEETVNVPRMMDTVSEDTADKVFPKRELSANGSFSSEEQIASGQSMEIPFHSTQKQIFVTAIYIDAKDYTLSDYVSIGKGGLRVKLRDSEGNILQNDYQSLEEWDDWEPFYNWFYSDNYFQEPGNYVYVIENTSNVSLDVECVLKGYTSHSTKAKLKKKVSVKRDDWVKIGTLNAYPGFKKFTSSKKKVVQDWLVEDDGSVYVLGRERGTSKITLTLNNGKKYKTTVTVTGQNPDFYACLWDYDTYDNCFTVAITNNGDRSISIIRKGAKVVDIDYKSYNRKMKSSKAVTVKPDETKFVSFYVKGRPTWPEYEDFTLYAKFKYDGKTYTWHTWDEDSVYKNGKNWYSTYWDEDDYEDWDPESNED